MWTKQIELDFKDVVTLSSVANTKETILYGGLAGEDTIPLIWDEHTELCRGSSGLLGDAAVLSGTKKEVAQGWNFSFVAMQLARKAGLKGWLSKP